VAYRAHQDTVVVHRAHYDAIDSSTPKILVFGYSDFNVFLTFDPADKHTVNFGIWTLTYSQGKYTEKLEFYKITNIFLEINMLTRLKFFNLILVL
jgi:hypothetical protein